MKLLRKLSCAALSVALIASCVCGCGGGKNYSAKNTEYIIGVSGPLTGGAAKYGVGVQDGAQLAVDEINANGGLNGVKFKLVALDDMNDASKISGNYASLIEGGMQVSLGSVTSTPAKEFKKYANEDNLFFLTPSASSDAVVEYDDAYQMCFADGNQGAVSAKFVNENYAGQTIGVFYKSDDVYSKGIYDQFKENLDSSIKTVDTLFTDANTNDFSSQIDSLKDCKFVFMPIYVEPASVFMLQAKGKISADAVYYGCDGLDGIDSYEGFDLKTIPQEVSMLSHFNSNATTGVEKEFVDKYLAKYDVAYLNQFAASAYDCVYAIYDAMKEAKIDDVNISASDLCDKLKGVFNGGFTFKGVTGSGKEITWKSNGFVNKTAVKYTVKKADSAK